jgi:hypothetical protein
MASDQDMPGYIQDVADWLDQVTLEESRKEYNC